jgi:hypothetical protein
MKTALIGVLLGAAVSCGGRPQGAGTEPLDTARNGQPHASGHKAEAHDGAMGATHEGDETAMPPELKKFHDTLAPRWHAEHGANRMADTCGAIAQFHADASAIVDAATPAGTDAAAWSSGGKQLTEAVAGLDAACKASDAAAFEPAFERVHRSFHGLLEAGEANHEPGKPDHAEHEPDK